MLHLRIIHRRRCLIALFGRIFAARVAVRRDLDAVVRLMRDAFAMLTALTALAVAM